MVSGAAEFFLEGLPRIVRPFSPVLPIRPRVVRDLHGLPAVLARADALELRLATTKKEIRKAQRLRYDVFCDEGGAIPSAANAVTRRDKCRFDRWCDHLLVVDTAATNARGFLRPKVVGTYRLLRSEVAQSGPGFYSSTEFDLNPLLRRHPGRRFLELGRSCVRPAYRTKRAIDLLWKGIGIYAAHHGIDVLIGCSSLPGRDAQGMALQLSYAFHYAALEDAWQVKAAPGRALRMDQLAKSAVDPRRALASLPPLMKAYVRAGGRFASEAIVDAQFNTVDLFTVLPLAEADPRYLTKFGGQLAATLCN